MSTAMNGRIAHSRLDLFKAQEQLLDAVVRGEEYSRRIRQCSALPVQSRKRQIVTTSEIDSSPAKRVRLECMNSEQPETEDNKAQLAVETVQQPNPLTSKRPYAAFLEDLVGQPHTNPAFKTYRPESVNSFVTDWLAGIPPLSESNLKRYYWSDSLLGSDSDFIPRRLTKSAPDMAFVRDADGFVVPPTPSRSLRANAEDDLQFDSQADSQASFHAKSVAQTEGTTSARGSGRSSGRLVEDPLYRSWNLAGNGISMRYSREQVPEHITSLIDQVRKTRDSPGPSIEEVRQDMCLEELEMGAPESSVEKYFQTTIFPDSEPAGSLERTDRQPMAKHTVPDARCNLKISTSVPDMLYGYRNGAFPQQQAQLISMGSEVVANNQGLMYPFFVIEVKGDGPGGCGSLWEATNQCLGASASCVNVAERLNRQLRQCKSDKVQLIDSSAFSVAMNGTEARLYISWKHSELEYRMQKVKSFLLQEPEHFVEFRKYVRNIIDWGKDKRLKEIRESMDTILEESRKRTSERSKSRPPLSDNSGTGSDKRRKSSLPRGSLLRGRSR